MNILSQQKQPVIAWFSCGATSAVACKIALQLYDNVRIIYIDTHSAHPDNKRFIHDCEIWYNQEIEQISSDKFDNVFHVLNHFRYINGPSGAPCTLHLKKMVRYQIEKEIRQWKGQVWGFDFCEREINRAIRFKQQNPNNKPLFPLIEKQLTKTDCLAILLKAGIKLPIMYQLGYNNNNCIGCVKGGMSYWNKIRIDFPETFLHMATLERKINATCLKDDCGRIFLDELDPNRGDNLKTLIPDCSLFCAIEFETIIDSQVSQVLQGKDIYTTK